MCILKFSANILAIKFQINFDSSEDFNNIWRPYVLGNKNFLLFSFSFLLLLLPSPSSSYSVGRMSMKPSRPCSVGDLRDTQKNLNLLLIWLSNTRHGTCTLQICILLRMMLQPSSSPLNLLLLLFWNLSLCHLISLAPGSKKLDLLSACVQKRCWFPSY